MEKQSGGGSITIFSIRYATAEDVPSILDVLKHYNMHLVPSPEMPELDYRFFYVAEIDGKIVGAAGYKLISPEVGKTTLMAVHPDYNRKGLGLALQAKRMVAMISLGCEKVVTNADRPETISWYRKHFGYRPIGTLKKEHSFGLPEVDYWTTLESDLRSVNLIKYLAPSVSAPLIINAVLTGSVHSKEDNPNLPVTPSEIASDVERVVSEGAAVVHIHARDSEGNASSDPRIYAEIIKRIREKCPDVLICASTTGRRVSDPEARSAVLCLEGDFKPDLASLALGSFNFPTKACINSPETIKKFALTMFERRIKPEIEIFDLGMLDYARYLIQKGYLQLPVYINTLLGNLGTLAAREHNAEILVEALPIDSCWSITGIGKYQRRMVEWGIKNGGHVRTGLEDNLFLDGSKKIYATNEVLVRTAAEFAGTIGRKIATLKEARDIIINNCRYYEYERFGGKALD